MRRLPPLPRLRLIAGYYEALPDVDPASRPAFEAFAAQVEDQFRALPVFVHWSGSDPYRESAAMFADIDRGVLAVYVGNLDHPFLDHRQNAMFRAVHDFHGHYAGRCGFGPRGEFNAFLLHARMFDRAALPALAAETLGQSCWFNFGPHAHLAVSERPYARQKMAALPATMWEDLL